MPTMIENERQYRITRAWVDKFTESAGQMTAPDAAADPLIQEAIVAQYPSQLEEFRRDLEEYETLRSGRVATLDVESLTALPEALIRARIAAGVTQKELGARLGLKERQMQRYESTRYRGVSLERAKRSWTRLACAFVKISRSQPRRGHRK